MFLSLIPVTQIKQAEKIKHEFKHVNRGGKVPGTAGTGPEAATNAVADGG